jgi:hypothetical protein
MPEQTILTPGAALSSAAALLDQCRAFVGSIAPAAYTTPCAIMYDATIGQHVRHALDHFIAALAALDGATIDYDHRARDTAIERDPAEAVRAIDGVLTALRTAPPAAADRPVAVRVMLTAQGEECELASTLGREIAFAAHHAVHHNAMMSTIALSIGVAVPPGFGKAPSTLDHERRAARTNH